MDKKHLIIGILIAGAALYLTFRNVSGQELMESLKRIQYVYLLPSMFIGFLSFFLRAYRWKFLVKSIKETTTARLMGPVCIGFMGNLLPARAGEFIRAFLLGKKEGISFSASFATIFVERIFDMLVLLVLTVWLLLFKSDIFEGIDGFGGYSMIALMHKFGWFSLALSFCIIAFSYALIHWNEGMVRLIKFFIRPLPENFQEKILHLADSFTSGLHILKDFKSIIIVTLLSFVVWGMIMFSYYPIYLAFGFTDLSLSSCVVLMVIVCVFISIFPTPGFLGSFQLGCVVTLHNIFGIAETEAASFGMVTWATQFGILIIFGTYYIFVEGFSLKQLTHAQEEMET